MQADAPPCTLQDYLASVDHSAAVQWAQQQAQQTLQQEVDAMQASHAEALRAADREREALAQVTMPRCPCFEVWA